MKKVFLFALLGLLLAAGGCNRSKGDATLKISFLPRFNGEALLMSQFYPCPDGDSMSIEALNFFVSGIELTKDNGKKIQLMEDDAFYVVFDNILSSSQAQAGLSFSIEKVAEGGFSSISFSVGLTSSLNSKQPADFPSSSALGDDGNYWTAWDSYIFSRVEGQLDTNRTTGGTLPFLYHAGVADMVQTRTFSKTFSTLDNQTTELIFEVDASKIFYKSGNELDIRSLNVSHTAAPNSPGYPYALKSISNLADGISIR